MKENCEKGEKCANELITMRYKANVDSEQKIIDSFIEASEKFSILMLKMGKKIIISEEDIVQ